MQVTEQTSRFKYFSCILLLMLRGSRVTSLGVCGFLWRGVLSVFLFLSLNSWNETARAFGRVSVSDFLLSSKNKQANKNKKMRTQRRLETCFCDTFKKGEWTRRHRLGWAQWVFGVYCTGEQCLISPFSWHVASKMVTVTESSSPGFKNKTLDDLDQIWSLLAPKTQQVGWIFKNVNSSIF